MTSGNLKPLDERTVEFAQNVARFVATLPKNIANSEYSRQIIRSSASIGANYIEAGESLSRKDFVHRLRISRKEAKETSYWLKLIVPHAENNHEKTALIKESQELMLIFSSIASKIASKQGDN